MALDVGALSRRSRRGRPGGQPLGAQLLDCPLALAQPVELHSAEDLGRLAELDVGVGDDLHVVAPGICEVERAGRLHGNPHLAQALAHGLLVIDDQAEVSRLVRRLRAAGGEGDELVAHVDERHPVPGATAQLEVEQAPVPRERLIEVRNLEGDVIDTNQACHPSFDLSASPPRSRGRPSAYDQHMTTAKVLAHTTVSLDGFIAGPNDEMDWVFEHAGDVPAALVDEVIATTGAILAGRRGYEVGRRASR